MNALGEFLEDQRINKKNLSRREFAKNIHTSPDTLVRMIEEGEQPTIKFLRSVSSYTGASLLALLRMSFPDELPEPTTKHIAAAQKIDLIPEPRRSFILEMIDNSDIGGAKTEDDESKIVVVKKRKRGGKT